MPNPTHHSPRLLIIGSVPPPSIGPSIAMQQLVTNADLKRDFQVSFLNISDRRGQTGIAQWDWTNIWLGIKHALQCSAILIRLRPAVLYLGISQGLAGFLRDLLFILPAMALNTKVILHLRGSEFRKFHFNLPLFLQWLSKTMLNRCAAVIVLGESLRPIFSGLVSPSRIAVIPNGIDYTRFAKPEPPRQPGQRILLVSSLRKRKGIFLVLDAIPAILRNHPKATLTIVGQWRSRDEERQAQERIAAANIAGSVRFAGELVDTEKVRVYQEHDIFLFTPVEPEGLPWVLLEAMSSALPVITTAQGCIPEVVLHGSTGLICKPTPEAVSLAVITLLSAPETAGSMGIAGLDRVKNHFSEKAYIDRLIELFAQVAVPLDSTSPPQSSFAPQPTGLSRPKTEA